MKPEDLETHEQKYRRKTADRMFLPKSIFKSKAWLSLKTASACQVYLIFRMKCKMEQIKGKPKRKDGWLISNNGEIEFTYSEAQAYGFSEGRFKRAIDELVKVGLIDISKSGFGLHKDKTLYSITDRWQDFGTDDFVRKERKKRKQCSGFRKGNTYGVNSRK